MMMNRIILMAMGMFAQATAIRIIGFGYILGNDIDDFGCKPSSGYTWCNETDTCIPINEICSRMIISQLNQTLLQTE